MIARTSAQAGLALGLLIALAANLTYAVPRGPVTVGLGLIAPLVLPVALYIRTTFTVTGFWQSLLRETATLAVAGPAAAISYVHTYELVLSVHEPVALALLAPLSSDGLAGMATLALHRLREQKPVTQPLKQRARQTVTPPTAAAPAPVPPTVSVPRGKASETVGKRAAGLDFARDNWPCSGGAIALAVGCSRGEGDRIRIMVKAEKEQAS